MIYIVFAPPKTGKTLYLVLKANEYAFDIERNRAMKNDLIKLQKMGFEKIKTIPDCCVSSNFDMTFKKFRHNDRKPRRINPYRLGFSNKFVKTHFNFAYESIFITEAQKYLNSRMSLYFPDWQSRWYEAHEHDFLTIFLDTQRPMLIDSNIRELSKFIEVIGFKRTYNNLGKFLKIEIETRVIDNDGLFKIYIDSGKKDKNCYTTIKETFFVDPFNMYDCRSCKPKFLEGHFDEDIDYKKSFVPEETFDAYVKYLTENDDELPNKFYVKRSKVNEGT